MIMLLTFLFDKIYFHILSIVFVIIFTMMAPYIPPTYACFSNTVSFSFKKTGFTLVCN